MLYAIYEEFFPDVEKKLNRIAKKCAKYGGDFVFEITGEEILEETNTFFQKVYHKYIFVEVSGTAKISNWECVAILEIKGNGNVIRKINTEMEVPECYYNAENICEHCGSKRERNNLYLIHNTKTGEWKQVGGSCLVLYTGGLNMEYVAAYYDGIAYLEQIQSADKSMFGKSYTDVKNVIARSVEVIAKLGYSSTQSDVPTKTIVSMLLNRPEKAVEIINEDILKYSNAKVSKRDFYLEDSESKAEEVISYYKGLEAKDDFTRNVQILLNCGYAEPRDIGFLAYLPVGYERYLAKKQKEELLQSQKERSEFFGEVGKRYKNIKIQNVTCIASWENPAYYSYTYLHKITIEGGFSLIWKTTNALSLNYRESYDTITFTVKEHNEYKGEKQTVVTRCVVTTAEN